MSGLGGRALLATPAPLSAAARDNLSGLGLQANYTYAESPGTANSITGLNQPLTNLSPHSYNLNGWLDASASYRVSNGLTLALEGMNLPGRVRRSYCGVKTRPQGTWVNDRQISATATVKC
ncbi:MAG TPA: hypothetical protein VFW53_10245 [Gallionella sp.]|nr:hypothetical protein [Gallionella sp.]